MLAGCHIARKGPWQMAFNGGPFLLRSIFPSDLERLRHIEMFASIQYTPEQIQDSKKKNSYYDIFNAVYRTLLQRESTTSFQLPS